MLYHLKLCSSLKLSFVSLFLQTALKEAGLRADVQQKLFLKLSSSSNHTVNNDNVPRKALSIDTKANAVARSQNSSVQPSPATSGTHLTLLSLRSPYVCEHDSRFFSINL